mgnify:CR=1 FL=1
MITAVLAATLLLDPTPKTKVVLKADTTATAPAAQGASVGTLASVAVTLECTAKASGLVENCAVLGETHPGLGFGEAAVALMRDVRVAPGDRDIQFARTIQFLP